MICLWSWAATTMEFQSAPKASCRERLKRLQREDNMDRSCIDHRMPDAYIFGLQQASRDKHELDMPVATELRVIHRPETNQQSIRLYDMCSIKQTASMVWETLNTESAACQRRWSELRNCTWHCIGRLEGTTPNVSRRLIVHDKLSQPKEDGKLKHRRLAQSFWNESHLKFRSSYRIISHCLACVVG